MSNLIIIIFTLLSTVICFLVISLIYIFYKYKSVNNKKVEFEELKRKSRDIEIEKNLIERDNENLMNENRFLKNRNIELEKNNAVLKKELEKKQDYDEIKAKNLVFDEKIKQQEKDIEKNKIKMETDFKNLANEIIKQQKTDFTEEQNNIFKPFREQIVELKNKIEENNKISNDNKTRFEEQMKFFGNKSDSLTKQAQDLTEALKGNKKIQGNWGEFQLDNLLQMSGFIEGVNYTKQETVEEGKRPDFIINLPDDRRIVVDSKVSLNNYYNYVACEDEGKKEEYLKDYVNDIKKHIKELSNKEYNKKIKETFSLDYVLMFVPIERGYIDAVDRDNSIYKCLFENRVSIVTPSSIMPILMTIGNLWSVDKQNKNIDDIIKKADSLCKKIYLFEDSMNKIESGLKTANDSFVEAKGRLLEGSGNVKKIAEDIVEMGEIKITGKRQHRKGVKKVEYDKNIDEGIIDGDIVEDENLEEEENLE